MPWGSIVILPGGGGGNQHLNDWGLLAPGDAGCTGRVVSRARLSLLPSESLACETTGRGSRPLISTTLAEGCAGYSCLSRLVLFT